jgi:hypothetical protein
MPDINYTAPADLYAFPGGGRRKTMFYRRFLSVAEALQFAVEQPPGRALRIVIEAEERRYEGAALRALYETDAYPLPRAKAAS